jgi:hypothetical protein
MSRVALAYPKIPGSKDAPDARCVAFEKYDGTNLHWLWDRELGWYAFGTRRDRFDLDDAGIKDFHNAHPGLDDAPALFLDGLKPRLNAVLQNCPTYQKNQEIKVFTEYLGERSFAGLHKPDDPKRLVLFDVEVDDGMLGPDAFLDDFGALDAARVVYRGRLTGAFLHDVRAGRFGVAEGVICKGGDGRRGDLWMVKIKTDAYLARLRQAFHDDWEAHWE